MTIRERVPVVVYHKHENYRNGVYRYQVFLADYNRSKHTAENLSKEYECFATTEEVEAYCKGLEVSGILYKKDK